MERGGTQDFDDIPRLQGYHHYGMTVEEATFKEGEREGEWRLCVPTGEVPRNESCVKQPDVKAKETEISLGQFNNISVNLLFVGGER